MGANNKAELLCQNKAEWLCQNKAEIKGNVLIRQNLPFGTFFGEVKIRQNHHAMSKKGRIK